MVLNPGLNDRNRSRNKKESGPPSWNPSDLALEQQSPDFQAVTLYMPVLNVSRALSTETRSQTQEISNNY